MPLPSPKPWPRLPNWPAPLFWFAAAACLLCYAAPPFSDHPDTVRDLLAARDCADDGHCVAGGAQASFGQLRSGSLWPATLAALRVAGAPSEAAHWLVVGADAMAVALAAALAGPAAASAVATALLLITREHLVWSPALMPLVALLVAAAWHTAQRSQRNDDWLLFGLALGVQVDLHPVGLVYSGTALLLAIGTAKGPLPALAAASGLAGALGILQPEVALLNCEALARENLWPLAAAACLVLVGLTVVLRQQMRRWRLARNPSAFVTATRQSAAPTSLPAVSAAVASLLVLAAASLHFAALQPRYFLAALPPLALLFGQLPPSRAGHFAAAILPIAVAAVLGPAEIGIGHPWAVVQALASEISQAGMAWPDYLYRLQAHGCRRMDAAVNVELPHGHTAPIRESRGWQLVDLAPGVAPAGQGWQTAARWSQGRRPLQTWIRTFEPWLQRTEGTVCLAGATAPHACEPLRPGTRLDRQAQPIVNATDLLPKAANSIRVAPGSYSQTLGTTAGSFSVPQTKSVPEPGANLGFGVLAAPPWHMRTFPAATSLSPGRDSSQTTIQLAIHARGSGKRRVQLLDLPGRRCPWQIRAVRGMQAKLAPDGSYAELAATGRVDGLLDLARSWGPGCDDPTEWQNGPPCLREDEVAP